MFCLGGGRELSLVLNDMSNPWYVTNTSEHLGTENSARRFLQSLFCFSVCVCVLKMISEAIMHMKSSYDKTAFHFGLI